MEYRKYLKNLPIHGETKQRQGLPPPPLQKPYPHDASRIPLIPSSEFLPNDPTHGLSLIYQRKSRRIYSDEALSLRDLSILLWSTQGIKKISPNGKTSLRTVPSGSGLHPFETYLVINRVETMVPGLYRYLPIEHELLLIHPADGKMMPQIRNIANGQYFVEKAAVVFIWTVRPARTEWKYGQDSLKDILLSAGHVCQNLYLACEAVGLGTCAVVAYQQNLLDEFLQIDGTEEISIYLAPVGKRHQNAAQLANLVKTANSFMMNEEYAKAKIAFETLLEQMPENIDAKSKYAYCLGALEQFQDAERVLEQVLLQDPDDWVSMYYYACILARQQKPLDEILHWLQLAIQRNPDIKQYLLEDQDFQRYVNEPEFIALSK